MNKNEPYWPRAIPEAPIPPNQIHVWSAFLDITEPEIKGLQGLLSADEVSRAGRFHFQRDRDRYIVARGRLRQILGRYLEKKPHEIRFTYTAYGKPELPGDASLRFNLSHSDAFALYAFTLKRPIGIDIERISDDIAVGQIIRSFFSPGEINSFEKLPVSQRIEVFFKYWTRKEALLKATGEGFSFPFEKLNVSGMSGENWSPVAWPGDQRKQLCWYLQDLVPLRGYTAAIAVAGSDCQLCCQHCFV